MRLFRILRSAAKSTGLTGLMSHPNPRPALVDLYKQTITRLSALPDHAVYRQSVESITLERLKVVEETEDVEEIEKKLGSGLIEELIHQAQDELYLIGKMEEWKPWEELEAPAPDGQWEYFERK
ncbi:putative NADH dehydrogenase [ubiquinone] 1 alpha subcomplex subunit 5, mitochondrial [Neolecta irregularis DAH-3]|uniref:Putative NADH dehydrogenase [ubiquinone] 1 alpha subcomplex subunit 5, mitochondrial n=1 Tax=Neolecta irregularis (strain DAH-3) TaxID=1198029 RepID=A0A1U7LNG8_NEOID|nr:putative NADH dehydrogenase [ubiquinone] 1 alpha subcomplex subunit 5, mitochondrial [Neolecta irregularis DAH-3]|eukprot:OLL24179.1 putative NADH dehydrogenase [ubiquinone] 1 alpha subcomplex subunit 5, mitochondrial [Neolecta irregularis DAH-3]